MSERNDVNAAEPFAEAAVAQEGRLKPYALETLADLYIRQGRFAEASRALDQAEALVPAGNKALSEQLIRTRKKLPS